MILDRLLNRLSRAVVSSKLTLVPVWSCRSQEKLLRFRLSDFSLLSISSPWTCQFNRPVSSSSTSENSQANYSSSSNSPDNPPISVLMFHGLPQIIVPLPSRGDHCLFTLKPVSHTVGDFLKMLKTEDAGIDRALLRSESGIRIASTTPIHTVLRSPFQLVMNDTAYNVSPPISLMSTEKDTTTPQSILELSPEELNRLGDVRALVGHLYAALNVDEFQTLQESRLLREIETLKQELEPLERQREELEMIAEKRTNQLTWMGLGFMSFQFGILARLTWYEYSWDIMEPVTYFVTYGTAMAAYAYFVLTKEDYVLPDVRDRQFLIAFHKKAKKYQWDIHKYNSLKDGIAKIEFDLKRLRDPIKLRLPHHLVTRESSMNGKNGKGGGYHYE